MTVECRSEHAHTAFGLVEQILSAPTSDPRELFGYCPDHLSRILKSAIGETLKQFQVRIRLERSAILLRSKQVRLSEAAYVAGYADEESFIKSFRSHYKVTPGAFRELDTDWRLESKHDLHWTPDALFALQVNSFTELVRQPSLRFAAKRVVGDYRNIPAEWRKLSRAMPEKLLVQPCVTHFLDDGMRTHSREAMRADLGFVVPEGVRVEGFRHIEVPSGIYLQTLPTASSVDHRRYWEDLNANWVIKGFSKLRPQPGYDVYKGAPADWSKVAARISLAI